MEAFWLKDAVSCSCFVLTQLLAWLVLRLLLPLEGDTEIKAASSDKASGNELHGRASIPNSEAKQVVLSQTWMLLRGARAGRISLTIFSVGPD